MPNYKLVKRPDSPKWYIGWSERGRSIRVPTGTEDKRQAELTLAALRLEREKPAEAQPDDLSIAQVLTWYYDEHASKRPSADQADIAIAHLNRFFGASRVSAVNSVNHMAYELERRGAGIGWQTINRERMVLRAALNHAKRHHGLMIVPDVPTIPENHEDNRPVEPKGRPLSVPELSRLYEASEGHMRTFLLILMGTVCRPDAARDLEPSKQCDFTHGLIDLNPPGRKQTKKYRPVVPMAPFLRKELKKVKEGPAVAFHGLKIATNMKTGWRAMRDGAKLDKRVTPYSIRHTVSRWLSSKRVPRDQIGIMLGHRPLNTKRTDLIYAPFEPGYCREAVRAIQDLYRQVTHSKTRQTRASDNVDKPSGKPRKPLVSRKRSGGRDRD